MKTFTAFKAHFRVCFFDVSAILNIDVLCSKQWVFTLGLAMSCLVDILITGFLTHSLHVLQSEKRASTR